MKTAHNLLSINFHEKRGDARYLGC